MDRTVRPTRRIGGVVKHSEEFTRATVVSFGTGPDGEWLVLRYDNGLVAYPQPGAWWENVQD